ncbi:glycosyltransferase family 4 protein [Lapidilactobacillus bayanensis]|uniref:glycosyltransferase family 4 protein n=1 Tax=Lapidilactobacillus bayanensis TaxID=2485998 RepID=UPI000F77025B|nr:glycosyltransferase family 4 protein [Lapidilactobacillus bayanensis]
MKILQVTTISNTINAFLIPHIEALLAQGHEVELACATNQPLDQRLTALPHHEISFQWNPLTTDNVRAYFQLKKLFKARHYDLIHTHTPNASALTRLAARHENGAVMYTAHGFHFYEGASKFNWLTYYQIEKILARYTDKLVTINQEDYQRAQGFKLKRKNAVHLIPGIGTDIEVVAQPQKVAEIRNKYQLRPEDKILVFAAELSQNKNQTLLIDVMDRLVTAGKTNYRLFLLGSGPKRDDYQRKIATLNLERHVFLTGQVNDVRPFLELADVVVSSSQREGLPVNVLEAFAYGVPVVLTKIRGHVDLLTERNQGFLVENMHEMAAAIDEILTASEKYRPSFTNKYSINASVQAMQKIYAEMRV